MKNSKNIIATELQLIEKKAIQLISSDLYLINIHLFDNYKLETSIILAHFISKYKYFKKMKKNIISTTVSKNYFIIFCNGKKIATFFVLFPKSHLETAKEAYNAVEQLKWGVHNNSQVQRKFDAVLN